MVEAAFKMPSDLPLLSQFRDLVAAMGCRSKAFHIWYLVWQELFFRVQDGLPCGRLPVSGVPSLLRSLAEVEPDEIKCRDIFDNAIVKASRLLILQGDDYVCPRFIVLNAYIGKPSLASQGGSRKNFLARQRNIDEGSVGQGLLIPQSLFVDESGNPLTGEESRRIVRLIRSCDNALFQPERPPVGFSEGLIQQARLVLKQLDDEEINQVCNLVSKKRGHSILEGLVTEKWLSEFSGIVTQLA